MAARVATTERFQVTEVDNKRVVGRGGEVVLVVLDGRLSDDALDALLATRLVGHRRPHAPSAASELEARGFEVRANVTTPRAVAGRRGRIALLARRGDEVIAIGMGDRERTRRKLEAFDVTARVIVRAA